MKKIYIIPEVVLHTSHTKFGYLLEPSKNLYAGSKGDTTSMMLGKERDDVSATEGSEIFGNDGENSSANGPWETLW